MKEIFFVDINGNKIYNDRIASHIGLAHLIIKEDKKLEEEFTKSKQVDPIDFLVSKGFLKISDISYYRRVVYYSDKISEKQRKLLGYYCEEGYELDDLSVHQMEIRNEELR